MIQGPDTIRDPYISSVPWTILPRVPIISSLGTYVINVILRDTFSICLCFRKHKHGPYFQVYEQVNTTLIQDFQFFSIQFDNNSVVGRHL